MSLVWCGVLIVFVSLSVIVFDRYGVDIFISEFLCAHAWHTVHKKPKISLNFQKFKHTVHTYMCIYKQIHFIVPREEKEKARQFQKQPKCFHKPYTPHNSRTQPNHFTVQELRHGAGQAAILVFVGVATATLTGIVITNESDDHVAIAAAAFSVHCSRHLDIIADCLFVSSKTCRCSEPLAV